MKSYVRLMYVGAIFSIFREKFDANCLLKLTDTKQPLLINFLNKSLSLKY